MSWIDKLTHWGRVTHICISKLTIIDSDNGLSPGQHQAIIWTNAVILLIRPLGTNFNEILVEILTFSFMKMCLKVSSVKWRPFCLGLNVLKVQYSQWCNHKISMKRVKMRYSQWCKLRNVAPNADSPRWKWWKQTSTAHHPAALFVNRPP